MDPVRMLADEPMSVDGVELKWRLLLFDANLEPLTDLFREGNTLSTVLKSVRDCANLSYSAAPRGDRGQKRARRLALLVVEGYQDE